MCLGEDKELTSEMVFESNFFSSFFWLFCVLLRNGLKTEGKAAVVTDTNSLMEDSVYKSKDAKPEGA